jgi:hypothetical protein
MIMPLALILVVGCGQHKFTVNGRVVNHLGFPLSSVLAHVENHDSAWTGTDGRFTVPEVEIPYNVWLMCPVISRCPYAEVVCEGLTRSDPVLTVSVVVPDSGDSCPATACSTSILGKVAPQPADHVARVAFCAPDFYSATSDAEVQPDGN